MRYAGAVVLPGSGARELEGLPPLFGESTGEVEFLRAAGGGGEWLGGAGSDVFLPEAEVAIRVL